VTCTGGITGDAPVALTALFAAYAAAECTFTRTVAGTANLAALTVTAAVTGIATFPANASFPVVPVHDGISRLQVSNAVTSTDPAKYVDGKWPGRICCPDVCLL
jgi:hypothetical protein